MTGGIQKALPIKGVFYALVKILSKYSQSIKPKNNTQFATRKKKSARKFHNQWLINGKGL